MAQILVVEDEQALVDVIKNTLTANGHTVTQAFDGQRGLELARHDKPDLIIADQMLPLMTGMDLCKTVKEDKPEPPIPFLLMTAANVSTTDSCPDAVMRKPFSLEELEKQVEALLQTRAQAFWG